MKIIPKKLSTKCGEKRFRKLYYTVYKETFHFLKVSGLITFRVNPKYYDKNYVKFYIDRFLL